MREYQGWHWHTNHKAKATWDDQKQDGETNTISSIEFPQDRTYSPTPAYVPDDNYDDDHRILLTYIPSSVCFKHKFRT
jgi:hypothetical protein